MGDNIYLGIARRTHAHAVDGDRNAASAGQARLYSPVIMDPVYGYTGHVEATNADTDVALNWM